MHKIIFYLIPWEFLIFIFLWLWNLENACLRIVHRELFLEHVNLESSGIY